jgi:hypothetical protein
VVEGLEQPLHLAADSLPGEAAYFVITPPGALPGQPPADLVPVGEAYDVTASGALVTLDQPAVLKLRYDAGLFRASTTPAGVGLYRWDPLSETWRAVPATLDEGQGAVVAPVVHLGTYALLAPPGPWMGALPPVAFLPLVLRE